MIVNTIFFSERLKISQIIIQKYQKNMIFYVYEFINSFQALLVGVIALYIRKTEISKNIA